MPSRHFTLHAQEPLTPKQCDVLAGLDSFADGYVSLTQIPGAESSFVCYFEADNLMDAMKQALARFDDLPGVPHPKHRAGRVRLRPQRHGDCILRVLAA